MADDFGLKIGLEGEKEFKKALGEINQSFKVLGSEMKLVESQFSKNDSSAEALAARHRVLTDQVEAQRKKVEMLKQALANAAESFGENDRRTQAWQIQLNNAQAALNGMERELSDTESAMDDLGKEMDDAGDSADDLEEELDDAGDAADDSEGKFSKLGGTLKTVGVAMGAVVAAAAAAAVSLGKAVVEAYGEYEQLVGGIDTLFKDSSAMIVVAFTAKRCGTPRMRTAGRFGDATASSAVKPSAKHQPLPPSPFSRCFSEPTISLWEVESRSSKPAR